MIVLTAAQALAPAIERTRRLLFQPFRVGTFLKLCAVAVFTEGFGGNFNFSTPGHSSSHSTTQSNVIVTEWSTQLEPRWIALIAAGILVSLIIGFLLFYLITRLRFSLFHCLVYQVKEIRPGWQLYREPANRFFYRIYKSTQAGSHLDVALLVSLAIPLLAVLLVIALLAVSIDIVLRDFMLPHFALEDASAGTAWHIVHTRIAAEKGSFFLYAVLRILLPIAALVALLMILAIPMLLLFGVFAALFGGLHVVLANAGPLRVVLEILVGVVAFAIGVLLAISFGGPLSIWVRNFALVFYSGRYQLLGDVLFPPPPPPLFDGSQAPSI
jgi:hypothetical protein